ncbi:MAG: hypothetical protein JOZ97_07210 [Candidatus Eremiobacteraeota bacterium]|nr:hypothetical protein [Candidatus Eremiobacteraeota bacterium]
MHFSRRIERLFKLFLAVALFGLLLGAAPQPVQLDSQLVVNRYLAALDQLGAPAFVVFSYRVSQAGAHNIEQTHRIYRAGTKERDETVSTEGDRVKIVRVESVADRYAVTRIAPRRAAYAFLFLEARRRGKHLEYVYATEPLASSSFTVTQVAIDGDTYLPSLIAYRSAVGRIRASGTIAYAKVGKYWVPTAATAAADIGGHPTRERIAWSSYSFPSSLPPSTFIQPKGLTVPTIPPPSLSP